MSVRNILFIMVDQMRADCLGIAGNPLIQTPNLDSLAAKGAYFPNTYVQTAVCGPSRMCFYTGRYTHAHRSYWNDVPLPVDEATLATTLSAGGVRAVLCGKSHHVPDVVFRERHGDALPLMRDAGFEPWEVNEFWGNRQPWGEDDANHWMENLRAKGYELPFDCPMLAAFLVDTPDGRKNGWRFENTRYPTVIQQQDSDTAYMTDRAIEFMEQSGDGPWLLHLSFVKPHWPNVAPAPYNSMYDPASLPSPTRAATELAAPHPLLDPFRRERRSIPFDDEKTWREMRATYYGLVSEIDTNLGRLFAYMADKERFADTMIIFVSDHGEYLGDHWLFEKELFYESAIRVPLIIFDPDRRADPWRGQVVEQFVESIDIMPTCLETLGLPIPACVQGRSLLPLLRGCTPSDWRSEVFGDWDFRFYKAAKQLGLAANCCRAWMVRDTRFKYVHFNGLPDLLFDLQADPDELYNLAEDPTMREVLYAYMTKLIDWRQSTEDNSRGAHVEERLGNQTLSWVPDHIE
ncbi:MAG: alkaline phosphatase family protein [Caldilinea sp.]